jgi:hypothetical protein
MEYIYEAHDMIPKTFCRELIEKFDRDSRKAEGLTKGGTVLKIKKCTDLSIESYADWKLECNRIDKAFRTALSEYIRNLKLNVFGEDKLHIVDQLFNNPNITRTRFLMGRYGVGGHFNWHIDQNPITINICNFIIYLNDNEACTEILNGKKIKPEPGKIVFFPSTWTYSHCGQPVEKGNKYIITGFVIYEKELTQSLPFTITHD